MTPALAGDPVTMLVLREHGVGSAAQAQPYVDKLVAAGIQPFACGAKDKWPPLAMYMYFVNRFGGNAFGDAQARKAIGN